MDPKYRERLDEKEEEDKLRYQRFENYGKEFIDVMSDGIPRIESLWTSANDILEASEADKSEFKEGSGNRTFTSIYNLLCDIDLLDAFHDSEPYEINTSTYDEKDLIDAWEYVSGEEYSDNEEDEEANLEDKPPEHVDNLYHELKD